MKNLFRFLLLLLIPLFSCNKSDSEEIVSFVHDTIYVEKQNSEYYVKYHWVGNGQYHYCFFTITYLNSVTPNSNSEKNMITYKYPDVSRTIIEDEIICGPFKRNDKVSIQMSGEQSVVSRLLEIYVSKDNSPFALRKSTNDSKLEYIIDY